tara:strand:+ start:2025 stop:2981 length:957 start_codon:yes stop_codon:yes gene_type:complete
MFAIKGFSSVVALLIIVFVGHGAIAAPSSFAQAKSDLRKYVYYDRNDDGDFYCGCDWRWVGQSGGRTDLASCNYATRAQPVRSARIEWEHIQTASSMGSQLQCWQNGGRKNCAENDPLFRVMESDMHNLVPSLGEVNSDRSNHRYAEIPGEDRIYGACDAETDFKGGKFEPRPEVRGLIARVTFYMTDRYNLSLSRSQEQMFMAWDRMYPISDWEKLRDSRIAARMGHSNPFVTGQKQWSRGHKNTGEGLVLPSQLKQPMPVSLAVKQSGVRGNKNSKVYHLAEGCPSFDKVGQQNRVSFNSEKEAQLAGYRKAGNCK